MNLRRHHELKLWEVRAVVTSIAGDECIRLGAGICADEEVCNQMLSPVHWRAASRTLHVESGPAAGALHLLTPSARVSLPGISGHPQRRGREGLELDSQIGDESGQILFH